MSSHRAKRASFPRDPSSSLPPFRDHATVKLQKLLNQGGGTEQGRAAAIEAALYERYGHSLSTPSPDYNSHLRTLLYNMPRNNWLLSRVRAGELTAEEVAVSFRSKGAYGDCLAAISLSVCLNPQSHTTITP